MCAVESYLTGWRRWFRNISGDMKTYIQSPLKRNPDRVIIHVGTSDLRSSQDPQTIARNLIDIAKNITTIKNEIL